MGIATWNMANRKGAWDYLLDVIKPDYALLHEAQVDPSRPGHACWTAIGENSVKYGPRGRFRWGWAVWSRAPDSLREVPLSTLEAGSRRRALPSEESFSLSASTSSWTAGQTGTRRHAIVFDRIDDLGLWHCNRLIPPGRRQTYRGHDAVMDDHLFVSRTMVNRVLSCEAVADDDAPGDHFAVVLELEPA